MEFYNKLQMLLWVLLVEAGYFANIELKASENLSTKLEVIFLSGPKPFQQQIFHCPLEH